MRTRATSSATHPLRVTLIWVHRNKAALTSWIPDVIRVRSPRVPAPDTAARACSAAFLLHAAVGRFAAAGRSFEQGALFVCFSALRRDPHRSPAGTGAGLSLLRGAVSHRRSRSRCVGSLLLRLDALPAQQSLNAGITTTDGALTFDRPRRRRHRQWQQRTVAAAGDGGEVRRLRGRRAGGGDAGSLARGDGRQRPRAGRGDDEQPQTDGGPQQHIGACRGYTLPYLMFPLVLVSFSRSLLMNDERPYHAAKRITASAREPSLTAPCPRNYISRRSRAAARTWRRLSPQGSTERASQAAMRPSSCADRSSWRGLRRCGESGMLRETGLSQASVVSAEAAACAAGFAQRRYDELTNSLSPSPDARSS